MDTLTPPSNLRVTFYGVQGSGSICPTRGEREAFRELAEYEMLVRLFDDLRTRCGPDGRLDVTPEELLGGPINRNNLVAFRRRYHTPEPRVYGGWTTCVRVETADGDDLVFDLGSGFRSCAKDLQASWLASPARTLHVFGSHSHLDHTEGFDQAAVCFDPRNTLVIHGNRQFLRALDANLGIFSHAVGRDVLGVQTPVFYALMPAKFQATEITADPGGVEAPVGKPHALREPIRIHETLVHAFEVCHPAPCLAYRVERGGKSFVFCTDHELRRGEDPDHPRQKASVAAERRLASYARGADLLYRDGQYLRAEYDGVQGIGTSGPVSRLDWGHSCIEDVVEASRDAGVRRTLIGHHDPNRDWSERNWLDETLARSSKGTDCRIELAQAETIIDL